MRARKIDANHKEIVTALKRAGCRVSSLASVGVGLPDLLVGLHNPKRLILIEVKDGSKPPSEQKLTFEQEVFHDLWAGWPIYVVTSVDEALKLVKE